MKSSFALDLRAAARQRLADVQCHELATAPGNITQRLCVALPASYVKKTRQRYPLVVLLDSCDLFGSAVEMSRLMAQTRELRECIVIGIETPAGGELAPGFIAGELRSWCMQQYRCAEEPALLFSPRSGAAAALAAAAPQGALMAAADPGSDPAQTVPSLVQSLRRAFGTGHEYGKEVTVLQHSLPMRALCALTPLFKRLRKPPAERGDANPHLLWSETLQRNFEIFVVLPPSAAMQPHRRYPALFVLDANIEFSTVAETAARLAAAGQIEEIAVIGIGCPRAEGATDFAFRRFEEFSPQADGYAFDDALGRIFRSLFATRGQDARTRLGQAPGFYTFVTQELLPQLLADLPLDADRLGLLGHSAGGTFVGYALAQAHSPFRHYAGVSPGIGISGSWLMRAPTPQASKAQRAFLCIGSEEESNLFNRIAGIPDTQAYAERLRSQSPVQVQYRRYEGDTHSSVYAIAVTQALGFLHGQTAGAAP